MFLVTPSLHSSWRWYRDSETSTKQQFLDRLMKLEEPPSDAMIAGRQFESDVKDATEKKYLFSDITPYHQCVAAAAAIVDGGLWQEKVYQEVRVIGVPVLLYGKADVIRHKWIYDIKRTANYDIGKYTTSIQHPLYMFCAGIPNFQYIVTDGRSLWLEDYHYDTDMETRMFGEIAQMLDCIFLDPDFSKAYSDNWSAKTKAAA